MLRFIYLLVLLGSSLSHTLVGAVDLSALIKDTQRFTTEKERVKLVWWIPDQFWTESFRQNGSLTAEQIVEFENVVKPYAVFCVASLDIGPMGGLKARSRELLVANTKLQIGETVIQPLSDADLDPDLKNFFAMMKPALVNMLGQMGQGLEFIIYRKDELVQKNLDPLNAGAFQYEIYGETFRWRLPLGSFLPSKIDRTTQEEFPGNYNYNPFTGEKLHVK